MGDAPSLWTLQIKHGAQQLEISLPSTAKVQELHERLQDLTGAFVRKQKLIHKGKVLAPSLDLVKAGLTAGAKLMLLLSDATTVATQGQQALQQQKAARQEEAAQRVRELYAAAKAGSTLVGAAAASVVATAGSAAAAAAPAIDWQERKRVWEKTGIMTLRDLGLTSLPHDLFAPAAGGLATSAAAAAAASSLAAARVADLSHNFLAALPPGLLRGLTGLRTLRLERNGLSAAGLPWAELAALSALTHLSLDHNRLERLQDDEEGVQAGAGGGEEGGGGADGATGGAAGGEEAGALEGGIGSLRSLQVLSVSHNALVALPGSLGRLEALRVLRAAGNRLEGLPEGLGGCSALEELAAEGNRIRRLPARLAELNRLQTLRLDDNMITAVPPAVLRDCASLATLSLQGNPITADQLRATPGFDLYDARRVARCNKQLEAGVLQHAGRSFTEGAEDRQWSRWAGEGAGGGGGSGGRRG